MKKSEKITELIRSIGVANAAYYKGEPIMQDHEFDALVSKLKAIAPKHPYLSKVGARPDSLKPILERTEDGVMGSLNKSSTPEALMKWIVAHPAPEYTFSPKVDGLAGELIYRDYELKGAYTRGDGMTGEDVTKALLASEDVPHFIELDGLWVIRGEIYFSKEDFNELNYALDRAGLPLFKHPRNVAVGLVNSGRAYHEIAPKCRLRFIMWEVFKGHGKKFNSLWTNKERLRYVSSKTKIKRIPIWTYQADITESRLGNMIEEWKAHRRESHTPLDGIVGSVDDLTLLKKMGKSSNGTPDGMIAYKFPPTRKTTVVTGITWQVGRTGRLCPVVNFKPVILDGSSVSSAIGDNANELARLGVAIGRTVMVEKGGDIIPQIVGSVDNGVDTAIHVPLLCPSCKSQLEENGRNLFCMNKFCKAQIANRIENFCKTFDMLGFGPSAIAMIAPHMETLADLFKFEKALFGIMMKSNVKGVKLWNEVREIADHPQKFSLVLEALGIHGVGKEIAKKVSLALKTPKELVECVNPVQIAMFLESVNVGITGEVTLKRLPKNLFDNIGELEKLMEVLNIVPDKVKTNGIFNGQTFMFTGSLKKPRKFYEVLAESNGGVVSGLKKGLNFLVFGDGGKEHKRAKAVSLGAQVINEEQLMQMIEMIGE